MRKIILTCAASAVILTIYMMTPFVPGVFAKKGYTPKEMTGMTIVAHRGGAGMGIENSLGCIGKGMESGADMIEIDIHLSKDGQIIVCHDRTIGRTTDGKGRISDLTLDEIRRFSLVDRHGQPVGEKIPTLDEVLDLIVGKCRLLIEIKHKKNVYKGIEALLVEKIKARDAYSWITVQSFNDSVLETIHSIDSRVRLEKLCFFIRPGRGKLFDGSFTEFNYDKYHFISSFNIFHLCVSRSLAEELHSHGKEIKMWTLTSPDKAVNMPVDGIITDRPDLWTKYRR